MQPKLCVKCKKNVAVVFITKVENGVTSNEGYCLKCARSLGLPQIDEAVKQMGFSDEDLDLLSNEMGSMFSPRDGEDDEDEVDGQTATFPLLNQLFGSADRSGRKQDLPDKAASSEEKEPPKAKNKKRKFLDDSCICL